MKTKLLFFSLCVISCQTPKNEILSRYENQIKVWEKQTIQGKILNLHETDSLRYELLKDLKEQKLTRNHADWLNALNRRYEIFKTKQQKRFPDTEIPIDIRQFLQIHEEINAQNLAKYYQQLMQRNKKTPLFLKSYRYLEKYRILFVDSLPDEARLNIEKIRLQIEELTK